MTDQQPIDTQLSNHQETLSPELQQVVKKIQDSKTAWITAREKENKAAELVDTLRQRQQQAISDYELMKNQRSALLNDTNGEFTPEVKKLRAKMIEQRETADDLEELLTQRENDLITLPWDTGNTANEYVTSHHCFVENHVDTLLGSFLSEHGAELFGLLNLKYKHLKRTNHEDIRGVIMGANDTDTLFKIFINETFLTPAKENHDVINVDPVLSLIDLSPDEQAVYDCGKKPSPAQMHKYKMQKKEGCPTSEPVCSISEHEVRANNIVQL